MIKIFNSFLTFVISGLIFNFSNDKDVPIRVSSFKKNHKIKCSTSGKSQDGAGLLQISKFQAESFYKRDEKVQNIITDLKSFVEETVNLL